LFGVIVEAQLRLVERQKMRRRVRIITSENLFSDFEHAKREGYTYGDFQFCCNSRSADFLHRGVFSCYRPEPNLEHDPQSEFELDAAQWWELLYLAHVDKQRAFDEYSAHYMRTDGQTYWSDEMQMSTYIDDYHHEIDRRRNATCRGSEMITEVYVPQQSIGNFLTAVRTYARQSGTDIIYGTIRLIEADKESFLPWAKEQYACIIFNLHVDHCRPGIAKVADDFRALIDIALGFGGSYYLTYHRFATKAQLCRAYPQFASFLKEKLRYDPKEQFQSNWYRYYRSMFSQELEHRAR
ncbi:MAG: hypothetical protein KDD69_19490, partial [Bdellovibrionales bacterium]|nr:hypothetical protein [Bdellovibrionales bacterium]